MRLDSVSYKSVHIDDSFWSPRLNTNKTATLPHGFLMLKEHGYEENFVRAGQRLDGGFHGLVYQDSDAYKLLEGAAATLAMQPEAELRSAFDHWVQIIERAQMDDGYLNTHFQLKSPDKRWANLRDWHELYCAGHLIEAAVTDYLANGNRRLLEVATKLADHIDNRFGPDKTPGYPGHPELELALIQLAKATNEDRYYELARYFVRERGTHYFAAEHGTPEEEYDGAYWQDRVPIADVDVIEGHAVRAVYLLCAATDIVRKTGDADLEVMIHRVWDNAVNKRMYVTGGIGNSSKNEGFTTDYDLPNETAYQETCASIAMVFWAHRLNLLYGKSEFADYMETALYNAVLSGVSLDGVRFFYENPLASAGGHHRKEWYACACCPPNVSRLLAKLGDYVFAVADNRVFVNLFVGGKLELDMSGQHCSIEVQTDYPKSGKVRIVPTTDASMDLHIRIPGWCRRFQVSVDGVQIQPETIGGYAIVSGPWKGQTVDIIFDMPVREIRAHPAIADNVGRTALARGPIVYCLEECDQTHDLRGIYLPPEFTVEETPDDELRCVALQLSAKFSQSWGDSIYDNPPQSLPITAKAIPYCLWDNRRPGRMMVWIPTYAPGYLSD